jgi:hypothetical protein
LGTKHLSLTTQPPFINCCNLLLFHHLLLD